MVIDETVKVAFDTLVTRRILGLDLVSASGIEMIPDLYSGFSIQLYAIGLELACLKVITYFKNVQDEN